MNKIKIICTVFLIVIVVTINGFAQLYINPSSTALAGAYSTKARGAYVIGWNPANLGLAGNPGFSLNFGVIPLVPFPSIQISNSSISPFVLNNHFYTGGYLTDKDKAELLDFFPDDGLNINPLIQMRILEMSYGQWAFSIGAEVTGTLALPKSLFNLVFFGNEFNKPIDLSDTNVERQSVVTVALAHGREVTIPVLSDYVEKLSAGAAVKALFGVGYTGFERMQGSITTYHDRMELNGNMEATYGIGGLGMALDLGLAANINNKMAANVSLNNLFGFVNWGTNKAEKVEYSIFSEIMSEDFSKIDSVLEADVAIDTSYSIDNLTSNYPTYLLLGFQYDILENLSLYSAIKQYFSEDLAATYLPKVSIAAEYEILPFLPARFGIAFGGIEAFQWGIGTGLNFRNYTLDIGFSQIGGIFNHAKGFAFSFGQSIRF
ncbi:MAG: hypothetical protein KAT54_04135 [Candidatus Marinimicrobia bacterium]|nr:hypothetical protein [Candidatus Neomarinimicrobiota bacterium]